MNKIKKHFNGFEVLILMVLLIAFSHLRVSAQSSPCSKPRVAVIVDIEEVKDGEFVKHLNEQYPSQPKSSWLYQIQEKILEELRMNSPGTQFVPANGDAPDDCDYYIGCTFTLMGAVEDIKVAGLLQSEYIAYFMSTRLAGNTSCGIQSYVLNIEITNDDRDINKTIEHNISAQGDIGDRIKKFEETHRVPPRGPEMKISQDREYVSPLEEERELKIKIDVTDCKGQIVFDMNHGQLVTLPKKTERGELQCSHSFPEECFNTENLLNLIIVRPVGASATYTLKKGVKAEEDSIKILTCGIDKKVVKETKIQIHGLELKAKPEKKEVSPGEESKITITLSEVDKNGAKQPVPGKIIHIDVKGLVDGQIHPSDYVITNQDGDAMVIYGPGDKDKRIVLMAKFQPRNYTDSVEAETTISIISPAESATLEMTNKNEITTEDGTETLSTTITGKLKYNHTESFPDEGTFIKFYDVISWNVSHATAVVTAGGHEYKTQHFIKNSELYGNEEDKELLIYFDSRTGKAVRVNLPEGSDITFIFDDLNSTQFDGPGWYDSEQEVKGGDGTHEINGGEIWSSPGNKSTGVWKISRLK
jgi:hypothetical protein